MLFQIKTQQFYTEYSLYQLFIYFDIYVPVKISLVITYNPVNNFSVISGRFIPGLNKYHG